MGPGGGWGGGQEWGALAPREGEPGAENEYPNFVAVFFCSAYANTSSTLFQLLFAYPHS